MLSLTDVSLVGRQENVQHEIKKNGLKAEVHPCADSGLSVSVGPEAAT